MQRAALERARDLRREVEVEQVGGPEVDRDAEVAAEAVDLLQRAVEHERGERAREPALLRERQEVRGREQPAPRVLPAHERLDAARRAARQVGLGLVVQDELAGVDRVAQLAHEREPLAAVVVARRAGRPRARSASASPRTWRRRRAGAARSGRARARGRARCRRSRRRARRCPRRGRSARARAAAAARRCSRSPRRRARARARTRRRPAARACRARGPRRRAAARSGAAPRRPRGGRACR